MSPAAAAGGKPSRSASAIIADTSSGYHVLKIDGYYRTKGTPNEEYLKSVPFTVGGHRWYIRYYPNGNKPESEDSISLFLRLDESVTKPVKAHCEFCFVGDVSEEPLTLGEVNSFQSNNGWGDPDFIKREELEKSKHLRDDSFAVRCDIIVINAFRAEETADTDADIAAPAILSVPPSDLHQHLGNLLQTEKGADVVFEVGSQTFAAHRCVLAARSPVFSAELFGAMKESDTSGVVRIDDMEAGVFKALLGFMYTDVFPEPKKEEQEEYEEDVMAQHLLVAADRYNLDRLKIICQEKLCTYIDVGTVATILALAEQHHCHRLKKACFDFLSYPANLRAAVASDGFEHLSASCPSIMRELIAMLGNLVR